MDHELEKFESELKSLRPRGLDDELLSRLCDAADGQLEATRTDLRPVEASMRKLEPEGLSDSLMTRLEEVVADVPFPVDEKVVMFPGGSGPAAVSPERPKRSWLGAAAAVAIAGGLAALVVAPSGGEKEIASGGTPEQVISSPDIPSFSERGTFAPASFDSGVSDTRDLGVMWTDESRPMRVVRVVYQERVVCRNENGEEMVMDVPRVEYLMVPEEVD